MTAETAVFQQIVFTEALTSSSWKKCFPYLLNAGITTVEEFLDTPDEIFDDLKKNILPTPLARIKTLQQNLIKIKQKHNNSFSTPLSENSFFDRFEFFPRFACEQYLSDVSIHNMKPEIEKATNKIATIDYNGLTKHQATFIALYCQESPIPNSSFYCLVNQYLRERKEELVCIRPALYLFETGLRSLLPIQAITWRGMNTAPDLKKFIVGQKVCFTGICSSSLDKDQTFQFMEVPPRLGIHKRTLFKLDMSNGVSIQKWSCYAREQEVVASFCSRWEVIEVEENRKELFDSIGPYTCDYYIELRQLPSEPLFRSNIVLTGLRLLSKINYEKPTDLYIDFKMKFLDLFHQLADITAQNILESVLSSKNYWNHEDKTFKNNPENKEIFDLITQFLEGVRTLSAEFQHHDIDLQRGFEICEAHNIYATIHLLYDKDDGGERTIVDFKQLGFSTEWATKLYNQEHVKQELQLLYTRINYSGTVESPRNVSKWLSDLRFKHYIKRDGIMVGIYELAHVSVNSARHISPKFRNLLNGSIQFDNFKCLGQIVNYEIQYSDFAIAGVIFAVQFGMYTFQLWHGDITMRQYLKSISACAVSVCSGFVGGFAAGCFTAACAVALGLTTWPADIAVLIGTALGGLIAGGSADILFRCLSEKYFPDGEEEELNAQRKLYCAALETLACTPDSTMRNIQKAYYQKALATHPDRCDNKKVAEEDFKKLVAAYEIAKNYHEVLENACNTLNIPNNVTYDELKAYKPTIKNDRERERAYNIVYRHIIYNTNKWKRIRNWLDSDHNLKLRDSALLPIEHPQINSISIYLLEIILYILTLKESYCHE